jgi:ATPase subunit of ABC transporter with duplicated ATPase domains
MALLRLESVEKSFAGVPALRPATLELEAGEILGLIGENGAGKSTLIKLLSGVHAPDRGTIEWQGRKVRFASPRDAIDAGIAHNSPGAFVLREAQRGRESAPRGALAAARLGRRRLAPALPRPPTSDCAASASTFRDGACSTR